MTTESSADNDSIQRTRDSLGRCVACETFLDRFYELFIASSPKVAELFRDTEMERQKNMLKASLYEMLVAAGTAKGPAHNELARLAQRHRDLGVTDEMYDLWLESLVEAARDHDTHFSDELEQDWRNTLRAPLELMKSPGA